MLDSVHATCEKKTWMPIIYPKIHPAYEPLQTMQASSDLDHCVSVKPGMPPSQRSAIHALWPWIKTENAFAVFALAAISNDIISLVLWSFVVGTAKRVLKSTWMFQNDFSYLCNEI